MKYLLSLSIVFTIALGVRGQQQLELVLPVGITGITSASQENFMEFIPDADYVFKQGISTGVQLRYAFAIRNRFHIAAEAEYQRWNLQYTRTSEISEPTYLFRKTDYDYTEHSLMAGLNYRYRIIEENSLGLAVQAKTLIGFPFAGEYRIEDSRQFDPEEEPVVSNVYINDLIYPDGARDNFHLQLGAGLIYTYHFSRWSLIAEVNYVYKYHLSGHSGTSGFAIDWTNVNLGVGIGYVLGRSSKIEGNQDAFFKKKN